MKISVIIPVYNVEKTLRQCLDSVINQSYQNLEIICVDDASTDNSLEILKEYAQKEQRITIVENQVNLKLGLTRNNGMKIATGDYVHFLDSDDWMEPEAYEKLVTYLSEFQENIDVVHFLWNFICPKKHRNLVCSYNSPELIGKILNIEKEPKLADNWFRSAWGKLYRREFLIDNKIIFNNYPCMEDIEYNINVLTKAEKVLLIDDYLLNYRINNPTSLAGRLNQFYDCALKSYYTNCIYCQNLSQPAGEKILELELFNLLKILYGSFAKNIITRAQVRDIIGNLDLSIFTKEHSEYKWYVYYNDLMNNPEIIARLKYRLREHIKNNFYGVFIKLKNLREHKILRRI